MGAVTVLTQEEPLELLQQHAAIPIAFIVDRILEVEVLDGGLRGMSLTEVPVEAPWIKDYDAVKGEGPTRWPGRFDVSNWGLIAAHDSDLRVGGAVVAFRTPGLELLDGRDDVAALWDLRVRPEARSRRAGTQLFGAVERWAQSRGCRELRVETQNINVPACRFYARMGCSLVAINRRAYVDLPDECRLDWVKHVEAHPRQ